MTDHDVDIQTEHLDLQTVSELLSILPDISDEIKTLTARVDALERTSRDTTCWFTFFIFFSLLLIAFEFSKFYLMAELPQLFDHYGFPTGPVPR